MVEVRASRLAVEALGDEGTVCDVTREDVQTAGSFAGATEVQASRVAVEVLGAEVPTEGVSREDVQTAGSFAGATEVQVSRASIEVLAAPLAQAGVTREDVQTAGLFSGTTQTLVSRIMVECLARQGSAGPVSPLALSDDAHVFLHNWATRAELSTSFLNHVPHAPSSGAESRRGLGLKPTRSMKLEWALCDSLDLDTLERLEVTLRRITDDRFQVPIYMDQKETSVAYGSGATTIAIDAQRGRFFVGARVAIVRLTADNRVAGFSFHLISSLTNSSLTFTAPIGVALPAGSLVMPVMDCEVMLEVEADFSTARKPSVRMTVVEAPGASQLPPLKSDTPPNAEVFGDYPIWFEEPNWLQGIKKGRKRQGGTSTDGWALYVDKHAERSRQWHSYNISGKRDVMWNALEFFETRRGRLRAFWHIDQDQYMEIASFDASGNFVGVSEIGNLTDFSEEFDYVGVVMLDGTTYVRPVSNIQQVLTVFRITVSPVLPSGLLTSDVARVARARLTRFDSDEFTEVWTATGYMEASVDFIELLNEDNYPTT